MDTVTVQLHIPGLKGKREFTLEVVGRGVVRTLVRQAIDGRTVAEIEVWVQGTKGEQPRKIKRPDVAKVTVGTVLLVYPKGAGPKQP